MIPRNIRTVDVSILEQNMRTIRAAVPASAGIIAVVKADGYGHGAVETARAALKGGASMLAVASVGEGAILRHAGFTVPILVLGAVMESDVYQGVEEGLTQTVCSPDMVHACEDAAEKSGTECEVHMKIDSGMGRIGVRSIPERDAMLAALRECSHVRLTGVYTHFSDADGDADGMEYTREQFRRFLELSASFPHTVLRHCCNSAAIHRFPEMALDMVRAGISLYGYPPVPGTAGLRPAMKWSAEISFIKTLAAGDYISYGRTYCCRANIRAATVTCGYGDGYFRAAGKEGFVLIRGKRAKILGRVCMDQMIVDVSGIPEARVGDKAVLIGADGPEQITAEDIASWAGTISYEILLSSGSRVIREYVSAETKED